MISQDVEWDWFGSMEAWRHSMRGFEERVEWPQVV